ncbi:N-acetyl-gamma-glutamyl-phosphate reductase [Streptomyces sp. NPDC101150]|uniref:N-acetyl-gamma-glutamyl-phosphate reductase n=1 Tax=Streptomyces sp. NPDC101150 TaxID=3366114 RepID=UPI003830F886
MTRVALLGAAGLVGGEFVRLAHSHPQLELSYLGGHRHAGQRLSSVHPGLRLSPDPLIENASPAHVARRCDVIVCATPAEVSASLIPQLARHGAVVIDLSGAFRLRADSDHERWYPGVHRPDGLTEHFTFGLPELIPEEIARAHLLSLPGCYATAITLSLAPLVLATELKLGPVLIDAKGSSSGGGLTLREADLHPFRSNTVTPYAPAGHRHAAEVFQLLADRAPGRVRRMGMSAYGTSGVRGLLVSCYTFVDEPVDEAALRRTYLRFCRQHRFVRYRHRGETALPVPNAKAVVGSNYCDVTALYDQDCGRIIALGALDNLVKGAAGQAVQAINLRLGLGESTGLDAQPLVVS